MAWFKIDDGFPTSRKVLGIPRRQRLAAVGLWTLAGAWSAKELTDGLVPEYMVEELGGTQAAAEALVTAALWLREPHAFRFCNWDEYQPTKAEVEDARQKNAEKLRRWRERNRDVTGSVTESVTGYEPVGNPAPDPTRPDPSLTEEAKASSVVVEDRADVVRLLDLLDEEIARNGGKKPARSKKNIDAARLLLDRDGKSVEQVEAAIRWSQGHEFWRSNILSMSKLREQYDVLRLQAARVPGGSRPSVVDHGRQVDAILAARGSAQLAVGS